MYVSVIVIMHLSVCMTVVYVCPVCLLRVSISEISVSKLMGYGNVVSERSLWMGILSEWYIKPFRLTGPLDASGWYEHGFSLVLQRVSR